MLIAEHSKSVAESECFWKREVDPKLGASLEAVAANRICFCPMIGAANAGDSFSDAIAVRTYA
jgi:hypothetical protein